MESIYRIAVTMIPGIGDVLGKKLIGICGSAEGVFREPLKNLKKFPRVGEALASAVGDRNILLRAEKELAFVQKEDIRVLFFQDTAYPRRLRNCVDSPVLLYFKGRADLNMHKVLGVVGSRSATDYGKQMTAGFIEHLAEYNPLVVSGLAYGIDGHAHRRAVDAGLPTIGVLGHGLDRIYPYSHRALSVKMLEHGGLLTDYPSGTLPDRENFPRRNRIIAGMCDAILVVEAALKGGALITADIANSYNRDVYAIPGRISDPLSAGCNQLIRMNKAALVQSADDLAFLAGWKEMNTCMTRQKRLFIELTPDEEKIVQILTEKGRQGIDEISLQSEISMSKASAALLNLEFEGVVKSWPGKEYSLL